MALALLCAACGGDPGEVPPTGGETGGTSSVATGGASSTTGPLPTTGGATSATPDPYENMPYVNPKDIHNEEGLCTVLFIGDPNMQSTIINADMCNDCMPHATGGDCCVERKLADLAEAGYGPVDYFKSEMIACIANTSCVNSCYLFLKDLDPTFEL
jgi:hypothetical protein